VVEAEAAEVELDTAKCNLAMCRRNRPPPVLELDARNPSTRPQPRSKPSSTDTTTSLR
jgi:hypothetical protein